MWYLQTDVLLRLFIACGAMILISGLSRLPPLSARLFASAVFR